MQDQTSFHYPSFAYVIYIYIYLYRYNTYKANDGFLNVYKKKSKAVFYVQNSNAYLNIKYIKIIVYTLGMYSECKEYTLYL